MLRDPPHYLKPLRTTQTPKRLLWLSCHGYTKRKREHYEEHFQAAALGRTWWTARANQRRDTVEAFASPQDLWSSVAAWCPQGRRVVLVAYDLAHQMRLAQMLTHLPAMGWDLDRIVLERTASWCLLRNGKRSLMCIDLKSWCPVSWEKIAADVATPGTTPHVIQAGSSAALAGAHYRVVVIRDATLQILNWIEGENLGPFRPTGSGQSFSAYRRRFLWPRLLVHDDQPRLIAERTAMHTGRAEAWRHGSQTGGPFVEYDLHAAYATIGRDCDVPTLARGSLKRPPNARLSRAMEGHAVLADLTVTTDVECLPYNLNGRTIWPTGRFRTQVWDPEIRLALDYCKEVTCNHAWLYTRGPALRDFCTWVLDGLDGQTQVYGLLPRRVLKHWSRCLVGRLGLRYRSWHRFGPQDPPDVRLVEYWDLVDGVRTEMLLAGSQALVLGEMQESRESLPQVPGWIMSECRMRLWRQLALAGRNLVYCDTDSVIVRAAAGSKWTDATFRDCYGTDWDRKGTYQRLTIHGPRNIELGHSRRVAGLPLTAEQVRPLEFTGEVMRSVKHSMRSGELDLVVSVPRTFHLSAPDLRRRHNDDGSTSPFELQEACL